MGRSSDELIVTLLETVSDAVETPIPDLPLLTNVIDPDALSALVPSDPTPTVTVSFTYAGQRVLVHAGHIVYVRPINDGRQGPSSMPSPDE